VMHGHEKSDSAIVALKPANKAAQSAVEQSAGEAAAAEPVEPRAETKGNADQQSTCRAQSRVSVSQALECIRKVAKQRKKERFIALFHHISIDLLEEAFYELKENAAPGVDRLTWTDYEADLERKLEDLHDRVHRGAYRALPSPRVPWDFCCRDCIVGVLKYRSVEEAYGKGGAPLPYHRHHQRARGNGAGGPAPRLMPS
jgi:RNA-directed DNA polymerase